MFLSAFIHEAGYDFYSDIDLTFFGLKLIRATEILVDGVAKGKTPGGIDEGEWTTVKNTGSNYTERWNSNRFGIYFQAPCVNQIKRNGREKQTIKANRTT